MKLENGLKLTNNPEIAKHCQLITAYKKIYSEEKNK